ncbi:MAG: hypothetical protein PHW82_10060 [Bacteroidales bacterium]|nr:hypothetical protein [Bacteroidales bacterium]
MEQRDFIKDEIEKIGKLLSKIISGFFDLKLEVQLLQAIEITTDCLKSELDIDIDKIVTFPKKELNPYFRKLKLSAKHLEELSELLKEIGKAEFENNEKEAVVKLEKAIELLDIADEISNTISFNRINKKNEINKLL